MGKEIDVKYRLFVIIDKNKGPKMDFPWEGKDLDDPILKEKYCCLKRANSGNSSGVKLNGSKLEGDVTDFGVQISTEKDKSGKRIWDDYKGYMEEVHEPIRYNSSM